MKVNNYMTDFKHKSAELLIFMLIKSIPKLLKPANGWPDINLTNSLFHSYGVMYRKYYPTGRKEEEDNFKFNMENNVWAFTADIGKGKSDIYLALKQRLENKEIYNEHYPSIEHVVFHEIGHQYYFNKGINVGYFEAEHLADIYANACMINLYQKNKNFEGYYCKFSNESLEILKAVTFRRIMPKKLLTHAQMVWEEYGVI